VACQRLPSVLVGPSPPSKTASAQLRDPPICTSHAVTSAPSGSAKHQHRTSTSGSLRTHCRDCGASGVSDVLNSCSSDHGLWPTEFSARTLMVQIALGLKLQTVACQRDVLALRKGSPDKVNVAFAQEKVVMICTSHEITFAPSGSATCHSKQTLSGMRSS